MQESDWPVTSHVTSIVSHPANQMAKEGGMAVGAELKTFHMQVHLSSNENDIYSTYDPMVGLKTAAFLGSFLMAVIGYIIYKVGCRRSKWTSADRLFIENYQRMILETEAHYHAHTTDVNHHSPLSPGGKDANVAVSEHLCNQQLRRTSDAFNAKDVASCKKVKLDERIMEEASVQCVVDAPLTHYCCPYSPSNSTNNFHGDHLTLTTTDHNDNDDVIADGYNRKRNCVDVLDGDCYYFRCGDTYHALSYDDFIFTVDDVNSATASSEDFLSTSCVASYAEPDFASICGGVYSDNCSLAAARDPYASADWLSSPVHAASHLRGISHGNSPIHAWTGSKSRSLFSTNSGLLTDKENFAPDTATVAVGTNGSHHMGPGRQEGGEEEVDNSPVWSITSRIQVPSRIFLSAVEVHAASAYVPPNLTMSQ